MAQPGGPMFDPDATAAARRRTQRRRTLGAFALVVGAAALALVIQGRRTHREPRAAEPGGPSIAGQLRAWHDTAGPTPTPPQAPLPFLDLYEQAQRDVGRAVEATDQARRSIEQAKAGGVAPAKLDALRDRLAGEEPTPPPLSTERAL